jgi:hypothetical protein
MQATFYMTKDLERLQAEGADPAAMGLRRAVERSRIEDAFELKYGYDRNHLFRCVDHYQLVSNPEITEFRNNLMK